MKRVQWPYHPKRMLSAAAGPDLTVVVTWEDGSRSSVSLSDWIDSKAIDRLRDPLVFSKAGVNEYGSAVVFIPDEVEIDSVHLQLLESEQRGAPLLPDALARWRARHGLSQVQAARELGVSPRQWQNYEAGRSFLPWTLALACVGWEAMRSRAA